MRYDEPDHAYNFHQLYFAPFFIPNAMKIGYIIAWFVNIVLGSAVEIACCHGGG